MARPMTMPMCSPATARRWANPESRNAARSAGGIAAPVPVSSVAAIAPSAPGSAAMIRWDISSRSACTDRATPLGGA